MAIFSLFDPYLKYHQLAGGYSNHNKQPHSKKVGLFMHYCITQDKKAHMRIED